MLAHTLLALHLFQATPSGAQPEASYWQQHVDYRIRASLDEDTGVLSGSQMVHYFNRSPDTLTSFSLHLYLNAFRPGSRWAARDSIEGLRRFNDLVDPDFAFNHIRTVRIMGRDVTPIYPFAPDSTIVRFELPRPLAPGDSLKAEMDWDARPSTLARRQGRRGRAFDFAQWYPRVVAYDRFGWNEHPLYPAGEFYGDFGTYLVQLDVPEDQVIGATGVPVCGDPGWQGANRNPARPAQLQGDFYSNAPRCSSISDPGRGRKRVVFYAEDVHHFAISMNPEYRYEGGQWGDIAIHVLYQPGDEESWGGGTVVEQTQTSLAWLGDLFGPYPWPQMTVVHRIEGGGTEFPMMQMNGGPGLGLNLHEGGHNYLMGILANNEWREGFLDEGFSSFQTGWFFEEEGQGSRYSGLENFILALDLDGRSEPVSLVSEDYRDFITYSWMIYGKGHLFYHQLRYIVGDSTMRKILRTYYDRWKLKHVDEHALRQVAEEVSGMDLSTFFAQWLHGDVLYDYAVGRVERRPLSSDRWRTRVEVVRLEEGRIPVDVQVIAGPDTATRRVDGLARREWVELETRGKPGEVRIDPDVRTHDWNMLNNRKKFGLHFGGLVGKGRRAEHYVDTYFSERVRRDRMAVGWAPALWYNDVGGVTLGVRARENYLGRFEENQLLVSGGTGWGVDSEVEEIDFFLRLRNPVWLKRPNHTQTLDVFRVEGRFGARLALERTRQEHVTFGPTSHDALTFEWVHLDDLRFVDRGLYDDASTVELRLERRVSDRAGPWQLGFEGVLAGGLVYNRNGLAASGRPDLDPFYGRLVLTGTARRSLGDGLRLGIRAFAGAAGGGDEAVKQRQVYAGGADPLAQLSNPFLRSRGALFVGQDVQYHVPGGANVRGIDPRVSTAALLALNVELEQDLLTRADAGLFTRVSVAGFGDLAQGIGGSSQPLGGGRIQFLADAGVGLRAYHRIGQTEFVTRIDLPIYVSRPELAHDRHPGNDEFGFRWSFSFEPGF